MILYFTGTGNTKFVAEYIADHTGDECISLNEILKYKQPLSFSSEKPFVIAAPIYAWGYPEIILKLISKAEFTGSDKIYFIATMGGSSGDADKVPEKLAAAKNMEYLGFCSIEMPNNFINGGNIPTADKAEKIIKSALPLMKELSERIAAGEPIKKYDRSSIGSFVSGPVNSMFNRYFISSKNFTVSSDCTGCGLCVRACPVNNIVPLDDGKPGFDQYCLNCYSCIHRCPKEAINIGKRTEKYDRYICPEYSEWKKRGLV